MELVYKILILLYAVSMVLELIFLAVPSEESHTSLLKSKMGIRTFIKFILGAIGLVVFLGVMVFPFINASHKFNSSFIFIGLCFIIIGRILTLKGSIDIRNHFSNNALNLLDKGIFKYSRNPILLGLNISLLGFLVAIGKWQFFLLSLIFYIGMHIKVLDEEKFLAAKFGNSYNQYKNTTNRYL